MTLIIKPRELEDSVLINTGAFITSFTVMITSLHFVGRSPNQQHRKTEGKPLKIILYYYYHQRLLFIYLFLT